MGVIINQVHDDGTAAVGSGVLSQVVASRELLTTLVAFKGLLLCVERAVVALEVFLAAETAVAKITDKGLGGVLSKRLLASSAVGRSRERSRRTLGTRGGAGVATLSSLVGRFRGVARVGSGSSNVHHGSTVAFLRLRLLDSLVLVAVLRSTGRGTSGRRARVGRELESLVLVKGQILVTNEATVAERNDWRTSASTRSGDVSRGVGRLLSKVDKAVDEVVLRVKLGKVFKGGEAVGSRVEVKRLRSNLGLNLDLVGTELRSKSAVDGAGTDSQVSWVAEVNVQIRSRDRSRIGRGRGRKRWCGQDVAGGVAKRGNLSELRLEVHRCHWRRSAVRPVEDCCLNRLQSLLEAVEAIETWEHGVHGSLKHFTGTGATDGAARGWQRWCRWEVRVLVELVLQQNGGLMRHWLRRGSGSHDGRAIAVQSGRLRVAGRTGSWVDGSRRQRRDHGIHVHLLLRVVLSDVMLGLCVVEVERTLANGLGHHCGIHFFKVGCGGEFSY
jgi:hypothetical protein